MQIFPVAASDNLELLRASTLNRDLWLNRNWELAQEQDKCRNFVSRGLNDLTLSKNLFKNADTGEL
jgi:hypothetical protein